MGPCRGEYTKINLLIPCSLYMDSKKQRNKEGNCFLECSGFKYLNFIDLICKVSEELKERT
jgi:hypothetical protein